LALWWRISLRRFWIAKSIGIGIKAQFPQKRLYQSGSLQKTVTSLPVSSVFSIQQWFAEEQSVSVSFSRYG
jgi:hypothetical protein